MRIVDAIPEHANSILPDVRPKDRAEWVCGTGAPFEQSLRAGIAEGVAVRTALDPEGLPMAVWGLAPALPGEEGWRAVWFAATVRAERYVLAFHKSLDDELGRLHSVSPALYAIADNRNTLHLRWLRRIGFMPRQEGPIGPLGLSYTLFTRITECAPQP